MGFSIPSLPNVASGLGNLIGVGSKPAPAPTAPTAPSTPAAPTTPVNSKPVDSFETAGSGKPAICGGNTSTGVSCFPDSWGSASGGGGSGAGINPSRGGN